MIARTSRALLLLAPLAVMSACQSPDVGAECLLSWNNPATVPDPSDPDLGGDYIEFNAANGCENLVCILSPAVGTSYASRGPGVGYCSKPCVANRDCYQADTGLVCRAIVLDPDFMAALDPETRARYLGEIQYSSYCALEK